MKPGFSPPDVWKKGKIPGFDCIHEISSSKVRHTSKIDIYNRVSSFIEREGLRYQRLTICTSFVKINQEKSIYAAYNR